MLARFNARQTRLGALFHRPRFSVSQTKSLSCSFVYSISDPLVARLVYPVLLNVQNHKIVINRWMKFCFGCNKLLALDLFHRKRKSRDGRQRLCKVCQIALVKKTANPERIKAYAKWYIAKNRAKITARQRLYYAKHRERWNASRRVRYRERHPDVRPYRVLTPMERIMAHRISTQRWRERNRERLNAIAREKYWAKKLSTS